MSTVTPLLNLVKPATPEQFSLATYTANLDLIDAKTVLYSTATATLNNSTYDLTGSVFTRIRTGADKGIVVANIVCKFDNNTLSIPGNANSAIVVGTVVPSGFRPSINQGLVPVVISGAGAGGTAQMAVNTDGQISIRSSGAAYTSIDGSQIELNTTWRWDGNL